MERSQLNEIIDFVSGPLGDVGVECLEVEWDAKDRILRLYIDRPGGVVIDDCVAASRKLDELEELNDQIDGTYNLEVSTPGVERPLRTIEHFEAHQGQEVEAVLVEKFDERKHSVGTIEKVDSEKALVTLDTKRGPWQFPIEKLQKCRLKYSWDK